MKSGFHTAECSLFATPSWDDEAERPGFSAESRR